MLPAPLPPLVATEVLPAAVEPVPLLAVEVCVRVLEVLGEEEPWVDVVPWGLVPLELLFDEPVDVTLLSVPELSEGGGLELPSSPQPVAANTKTSILERFIEVPLPDRSALLALGLWCD